MSNVRHTPTPWHIANGNQIKDELMPFDRDDRDTALIATVSSYGTSALDEANAAFIVRACNSHDKLVALTLRAQEILSAYLPPDGSSDQEAITALLELFDGPESRAALAAAGVAL